MDNKNANSCYTVSIPIKDETNIKNEVESNPPKKVMNKNDVHVQVHQPMSYFETITHLLKGNIGASTLSMGAAYKNGGIILSPFLMLFICFLSVHNQFILVDRCRKMREIQEEKFLAKKIENPDFAETVELCFVNGPPKLRNWSKLAKFYVNFIISFTQLGICCILLVFITRSIEQLWKIYSDYEWNLSVRMLIILIPIILVSCITELKGLAPVSAVANVCIGTGLALTFFYMFRELPDIRERHFIGDAKSIPLFLGTTIYSFEGIALVLPLRNAMKKQELFTRRAGVLNVGMFVVTTILALCGFFGYWKWGEETEDSLILNLPQHESLAQIDKLIFAIGALLSYPLQLFVAIQLMWSSILERTGKLRYPKSSEILFRIFIVIFTFIIAELIPLLSLIISFIGSIGSTSLSLLLPPTIELVSKWGLCENMSMTRIMKNIGIILFGVFCFGIGTYESVHSLIDAIMSRANF